MIAYVVKYILCSLGVESKKSCLVGYLMQDSSKYHVMLM